MAAKPTLRPWDSAKYLDSPEAIELYLQTCFEEAGDDPAFIAKALGVVARARGMSELAKQTGLGRESLYKALSGENNPSFGTIAKVCAALGVRLTVTAGR
ncbi:MAG: putative addiction module antidote protein [Azonexus sp.]|jgi:probable addiction module antidote protein|nr:putative addiction module antidote protein [Azonexus sp.]